MRVFVFGYGSLGARRGAPARLPGWRREWNVAMDNRVTIPGYKYYLDEDGRRPDVFVTFLNLVPGDAVEGVVLPAGDLAALDARERNYARAEVMDGPVFAYIGLDEAVERFESGRRAGTAVVARAYLDAVRSAFPDVEDPPVPVLDLTRVDLP